MNKRYFDQDYYNFDLNISMEYRILDEKCLGFYHIHNAIIENLSFIKLLDDEYVELSHSTCVSIQSWINDLLMMAITQAGIIHSYGPRLLPPVHIQQHKNADKLDHLDDLLSRCMPDGCFEILCDIEDPDDLDNPDIVGDSFTGIDRNLILNCYHVWNDVSTYNLFTHGYLEADTPQAIEQVFRRQCKHRKEEHSLSNNSLLDLQSRFSTLAEALNYINSQYTHDGIVKDYIHSFEKDIHLLIWRWRKEKKYYESDLLPLYDYFNLRDQLVLHYDPQLYYQLHPDEAPKSPQQGDPTTPTASEQKEESSFRQRHLAFFQAAEIACLIDWHGDHYETTLGAVELDYLLGCYFCHDTTRTDAQGRKVWVRGDVGRGRLPRLELKALFPQFHKLGDHRNEHTRINSPKNGIPCNTQIVKKIDTLIGHSRTVNKSRSKKVKE